MRYFASFFLLLLAGTCSSALDLVVSTKDGKVNGTAISSPVGRNYYAFRGIPYAKPPLGKLRFQPPEKPNSWTDVLDASTDAPACYYIGSYTADPEPLFGYSEDCLYINVYLPDHPTNNKNLTVMFYIYGGGFVTGTSDSAFYDPTPFLEENVIVVTFNYRLGIFGFLSTEDEILPGNAALKDQLLALKWARDNVEFFGGNPEDITIYGESAGGMSVGYHLVSPLSKDLFAGAILQSGTCLKYFFDTGKAKTNAASVASQIDSSITDSSGSEEIISVLQSVEADLLVNLTLQGPKFLPVLEAPSSTAFITGPFYEQLEAGNFTRVPIIIGFNSEELISSAESEAGAKALAEYYDQNILLVFPEITLKENVSELTVSQEVKEAYVGKDNFTDHPGLLLNLLSDEFFPRPSIKHATLQSEYTDVYLYVFSYVGTISGVHPEISEAYGRTAHAEDLPHMFNISTKPLKTDGDFLTRRRFIKLWTNFAKTKNPTPDVDDAAELQGVVWEKFDRENLPYLDIGQDLELKYNPRPNVTAFWDYLYETYSVRPYNSF